ncbi:hypothetical protein PybrP1_001649 [[Pythium] brassicae (nom. inval.)]|nr:hypothetical protein PybrP1_001649 [[Pythium] brassicae (nom. inval.)]
MQVPSVVGGADSPASARAAFTTGMVMAAQGTSPPAAPGPDPPRSDQISYAVSAPSVYLREPSFPRGHVSSAASELPRSTYPAQKIAAHAFGVQEPWNYMAQVVAPGAYGGYGYQANSVPAPRHSSGPTVPVSLRSLTAQQRTFIPYQSIAIFNRSRTSSGRKAGSSSTFSSRTTARGPTPRSAGISRLIYKVRPGRGSVDCPKPRGAYCPSSRRLCRTSSAGRARRQEAGTTRCGIRAPRRFDNSCGGSTSQPRTLASRRNRSPASETTRTVSSSRLPMR